MIKKVQITVLLGVIVLIATGAVYAVARPEVYSSTAVGFAFLLFSEIVFFGGIVFVEYWALKSPGILTLAGIGVPLGGYALIVFISSIIYMNFHRIQLSKFLTLQIVLLVALIFIVVIMAVFSKAAKDRDDKTLQTDAMMRTFVDELTGIRDYIEKKSEIDHVIEEIRFSDTFAMVEADVELDEAISKLKKKVTTEKVDEEELEKSIKNIEFLAKKRKLQVKNMKQGGI